MSANDRVLLGMKGCISEFELGVLRARMLDAARSKASRGELRLSVPFGYIWHREAGLGLDVDSSANSLDNCLSLRRRLLMQRTKVPNGMTDPVCQRRPIQIDPLADVNRAWR